MPNRFRDAPRTLAGLAPARDLAVHETYWGYIVRSTAPLSGLTALADRAARFLRVVCWMAVIGLWLAPLGPGATETVAIKALASVAILTLTYMAIGLLPRPGAWEFHVDLTRREVRTAQGGARGPARIRRSAGIDEIADMVLRRKPGAAETALCVRLTGEDEGLFVARGCETALRALYDRMARDFQPLERRVAAQNLARRPAALTRATQFPRLGPDEIAA